MSSETESIIVDQIKKIISINNGLTNFKARIYLKTKNPNGQFKVAIMTMERLETTTHIPYQHVTDSVLFNLVTDSGVYKDYVIVIKSDTVVPVYLNMSVKSVLPGQGQITEHFKALEHENNQGINEYMDPNMYFQGDIASCPPGKEAAQMYGSAATNTENKCEIKFGISPNDVNVNPSACNIKKKEKIPDPIPEKLYSIDYSASQSESGLTSVLTNKYFLISLIVLILGAFAYFLMGTQNKTTSCRLNL